MRTTLAASESVGNFSAASSSNAKLGVGDGVGNGVSVGVSVGNGVGEGVGVSVGIGVIVGGKRVGVGGAGGCAATANVLASPCGCVLCCEALGWASFAGCAGAPPVLGVGVHVEKGVTVGVGWLPPKLQPVAANAATIRAILRQILGRTAQIKCHCTGTLLLTKVFWVNI